MSLESFVEHVEMDNGLSVTTWSDDAPIIGFQVHAYNWRLRRAREAKGWTRGELARQAGVDAGTAGDAEKLRRIKPASRWKIALALGVPEDVLFPGEVDELPTGGPSTIEFSMTREDIQTVETTSPHDALMHDVENSVLHDDLTKQLDTLPARKRSVLMWRFGLVDGKRRTMDEVAVQFGVSRERIRQLEAEALRLLRQPSRSRPLRAYLDEPEPRSRPRRRLRDGYRRPKEPCEYYLERDDGQLCERAFPLPGWMREGRTDEVRRPSFWCQPCWDRFITARTQNNLEAYFAS
jgi:RNA polymerase sigma factor (sigma-70 family)